MGCGRRSNIGNPANLPNYKPAMDPMDGIALLLLLPFALLFGLVTYGLTIVLWIGFFFYFLDL